MALPQPNGDWAEVRRKKNNNRTQVSKNDITDFYVAGFPDGTRKEELRKPFDRFGKVVDVYFGLKKDYHKKNFAFVRYVNIADAKELENKLQVTRCKNTVMEVNISKHQHKTTLRRSHESRQQPTNR
ncbi:unnamed protein product [Lactuca virosa]|uniref:RRM domain-containing protein n=1 Tax=Lactuca virosa TaxID=75947 RepID=A0AAU9PHG2_9ASTR|nr:unnamed protein product [Lactuca virosa]